MGKDYCVGKRDYGFLSNKKKEKKEERGDQKRRKMPFPKKTPKSCILLPFWLVVQQTCKTKLFFLVVRTQKPSDFKKCEIYFTLYFSVYIINEYVCFPMLISYDCLF